MANSDRLLLTFSSLVRPAGLFAVLLISLPGNAQTFGPSGRVMRDRAEPPQPPSAAARPAAPARNDSSAKAWGLQFKSQVESCWKRPENPDKESTDAIFSLKLTREGLIETVRLVSVEPETPHAEAYQASGLRALRACQPYTLPAADYAQWRFFEPVFSDRVRYTR